MVVNMKKKVITLVAVCIIALGVYWNMNQNKEKSFLNCLNDTLSNSAILSMVIPRF